MPYSAKMICAILQSSGIPIGIQTDSSNRSYEVIDFYYYPHASLSFTSLLRDNLNYLLSHQKKGNICLQPIDPQKNPDVVFTESLLHILHEGKIGSINIKVKL